MQIRDLVVIPLVAVGLIGCGDALEPEVPTPEIEAVDSTEDGLRIQQLDEMEFVAEVVSAELGLIEIESRMVQPGHVVARVHINGQLFEADIDHHTRDAIFDGHDQYISWTDRELILYALEVMGNELGVPVYETEMHVRHTDGLLRFLSEALPSYEMNRIEDRLNDPPAELVQMEDSDDAMIDELGIDKTTSNDGVSCVQYNHVYRMSYTYASGFLLLGNTTVTYNQEVVGSYTGCLDTFQCMGRCGAGCENSPGGSGAWTLDCLEHDTCVYDMYGEDPGFGQNTVFNAHCKSELTDAWSDFFGDNYSTCPGTVTSGAAINAYRGAVSNWGCN